MKKLNVIQCLVALVLIFQTYNESHAQPPPTYWTITALDNPSPGYLQFDWDMKPDFFLVDNYGNKQYRDSSLINQAVYYKFLSNGLWIALASNKYYLYNQDMRIVDSIPFLSGSDIDFHDVTVLANGHYLLLYRVENIVDLSSIIPSGKPDAKITSNVLVETDRTGTVYWQWIAADHQVITDVTSDIDLTNARIEFTHINSLTEDTDGNIIVSFRHLDEISKINKSTGNFIWRMGGTMCKNNQFTFTNDNVNGFIGFSHQHSVSLLPNGNLLMYDNGNMKEPQYSRAVEYQIDQANKTATKVWEYRNVPDIFQYSMGNVSRLPNGNTFINWGTIKISEVKPDNTIAFELTASNDAFPIYRANRIITKMNAVIKNITATGTYTYNDQTNETSVSLLINSLSGTGLTSVEKHNYLPATGVYTDSNFTRILPYRWVINQQGITSVAGSISLKGSTIANIINPAKVAIYKRNKENQGTFQELATSYNSNTDQITANFTEFGEFTLGSKILSIPVLSLPSNQTISIPASGTFKWEKLTGATKYQIQVSSSSSFDQLKINEFVYNSTEYGYSELSNYTLYYWRIRGINPVDTSNWTAAYSFTTAIQTPELSSPTNNFIGADPIDSLKWKVVAGADFYWLKVSKNEDFSFPIIDNHGLSQNYQPMIGLGYNTKYFWKVLAYKNSDTTKWSTVCNFTTKLESPELISPSMDTINIPINGAVYWLPVTDAESYSLDISKNSTYDTCIYKQSKLTTTTFAFSDLENNKDYFWRVKASRKTDESNWSETRKFKTILASPILSTPKNGDTVKVLNIKFDWNSASPSYSYNLQFSRFIDFKALLLDTNKLSTPEFTVTELPSNTKLYWRVMATNGQQKSNWSESLLVQTSNSIPLLAPKLLSPANDKENDISGNFVWSKVQRGIRYKLQVSLLSDFKILAIDTSNYAFIQCEYKNLLSSKRYYWRVKAYSIYDSSDWSEAWHFITSKLLVVKLLSPQNDQLQAPLNGQLVWDTIAGIHSFQLQISKNPEFDQPLLDLNNIQINNYVYKDLEYFTTYYWRVRYIKDKDTSNWSNTWVLNTESLNVLEIPSLNTPANDQYTVPINGTLTWSAVASAKIYKISISTTKDFEEVVLRKTNIAEPKIEYSDLEHNQMYFWRVSAANDNSESQWSQIWRFLTDLETPGIISPKDYSTKLPLTGNLVWSDISGSGTYILQISLDSLFSNFIVNSELNESTYQYDLSANQTYYWRVKSKDYLNESQWSKTYQFTTTDIISVFDNSKNSTLKIFPNPADDKVILSDKKYIGYSYSIYNTTGYLLAKSELSTNQIDVSLLSSGSYWIIIDNKVLVFIKR